MFGWTSTAFDKLFEKATSHLLLEPDWESTMLICDSIRQGDVQPKYVVSCIKKKLFVTNPHVVLYTLQVLECCMKNCGAPMHAEVATRSFMEDLKELVSSTTNENVRNRVLELIQVWAHVFRNEPKYRSVQDTFNMLKVEGFKLQVLKESDAMFSAHTAPDWADGNCCHRCRTQFTVVLRKHHCRNCGQIFCNKCSSHTCPIPRFGIEKDVRVCEACWDKLNKPSTAPKSVSPVPEATSTPDTSTTASRKSEQELKEEEDLQLALALSQSEAESKEKQRTSSRGNYSSYAPPEEITSSDKASPAESELDRYLNRSYWEQKQQQQKDETVLSPTESRHSPTPSAPASNSTLSAAYGGMRTSQKFQNGDSDELTEFLASLRTTVEIFMNRMKSNSNRGRPIANDTHVQSLFMSITNMHPQLLKYMQEQDDMRAHYERLQDKLNQARDARAALDALREEHKEKMRREAEEAERLRQIQMAHKLEIMRKKKQEYLQYQRQLAIQRMQEQEREMQMRQEQQKQQYQMPPAGYAPPPHSYVPPGATAAYTHMIPPNGGHDPNMQQPYHQPYKPPPQMQTEFMQPYNMQAAHPTSMPPPAPYPPPQGIPTSAPMTHPPQMMMQPPPALMMVHHPQAAQMMPPQQTPMPSGPPDTTMSPHHQQPQPKPEQPCDPLIVFD